jgi:hypothetical protein
MVGPTLRILRITRLQTAHAVLTVPVRRGGGSISAPGSNAQPPTPWLPILPRNGSLLPRRQRLDRRLFVEPPAAGERVVALQLILVGDHAELHLGGRRIVLGRVEA